MTARSNYRYEKNVVGFEKALGAVKVIKDQIQYRSQSLLNLARGYFTQIKLDITQKLIAGFQFCKKCLIVHNLRNQTVCKN